MRVGGRLRYKMQYFKKKLVAYIELIIKFGIFRFKIDNKLSTISILIIITAILLTIECDADANF